MIRLELLIVPGITVVLLLLLVLCVVKNHRTPDSGWEVGLILTSIFGGIGLLISVGLLAPYQPKYWHYTEVSGTVASVSNELTDGSGKLTSRIFVVELEDAADSFMVEDQRITNAHAGSDVTLNCLPEWVYSGSDRLYCSIVEMGK